MIVVTGGAGFIGCNFVEKLNSQGIDKILIVDDLGSNDKWKNLRDKSFADYIHKDAFLEKLTTGKFEKEIDGIVHLGACSSTTERDAEYLMRNNYQYSKSLASWALERDVRFVYASSAATYGLGENGFSDAHEAVAGLKPLNMYGYSKQLFDLWTIKSGAIKDILGVKFFNVYGPNEHHKEEMRSVACKAYEQIRDNGSISLFKSYNSKYRDGEQKRDFIYVKDCAEVLLQFLTSQNLTGIFNLGTSQARSFNSLAKAVFSAMGKPVKINYIDMPEEIRPNYQYFTEADMSKLETFSDKLEFTSLEDGVRDYVENHLKSEI